MLPLLPHIVSIENTPLMITLFGSLGAGGLGGVMYSFVLCFDEVCDKVDD